jgi:hypothetical protein
MGTNLTLCQSQETINQAVSLLWLDLARLAGESYPFMAGPMAAF